MESFMFFRLSVAFFSCFPGFRHFSLSFGCFLVFRSFSKELSGFRRFPKRFSVFRIYLKVFQFSVTQKCHFFGFQHTALFRFSAEFFSFFPFSATFLVPFHHKYNAPSNNKLGSANDEESTASWSIKICDEFSLALVLSNSKMSLIMHGIL